MALTELKGVRLIVAFPHDSFVRPGAGDRLLSELTPHLPPLGIMLVSDGAYPRAYAAFQTHEFLQPLRCAELRRYELDLNDSPEEDDELPF